MPPRKRKKRKTSTKRTTARRKSAAASQLRLNIDSNVAREIWALVFLASSVLLGLSISGKLGLIGNLLNSIFFPIFGWGVYFVPVILGVVGLLRLFVPSIYFGANKIVGTIGMLIGILGVMHLPVDPSQLHAVARAGEYGGYVGFVASFLMRTVVGETGAYVVLLTLALVSFLVTFEISLVGLVALLKPEFKFFEKRDGADNSSKAQASDDNSGVNFIPEINVIKPDMSSPKAQKEKKISLEPVYIPEEEKKPVEPVVTKWDETAKKSADDSVKKEQSSAERREMMAEYEFPNLDLLSIGKYSVTTKDKDLKQKAERIRQKLDQFGISVTMHDVHVGPTVIQYTLKPHDGVKLSRITSLKNDLALTLSARAIRIEAPIPGKPYVGIEVPNDVRQTVYVRGLMEAKQFEATKSLLKLPIGRDVSGVPIVADLAKMPHLLVAGATGSGKSVCMNTFLISLLYNNSPWDLKMILIDPKRVELSSYNGIPHLLTPVITNPEKAAIALRWAVSEMNRRYHELSEKGFRNIADYNENMPDEDKLCKMIIVIDELADLMMVASKDVEASICRLAQMARAVGIHLIIATQRPSVDVITGLIKANIPARIAFTVTSNVDSRTILDCIGAEDLLGEGDMLYLPGNMSKPIRLQGGFISSKEIARVTAHLKLHTDPEYYDEITSEEINGQSVQGLPDSKIGAGSSNAPSTGGEGEDALYEQALKLIIENRKASASFLQRRLRVGYARAARLLDELEENGVIGPSNGAKARDIFITQEDLAGEAVDAVSTE